MLDLTLAAVGALGAVVAALSGQIRKLPLSEPLIGLTAGVLLGPAVVGVLDLPSFTELTSEFHDGTRLLLAVSVMAVALRYPFQAVLVLGLAPATALLLGTALAPPTRCSPPAS